MFLVTSSALAIVVIITLVQQSHSQTGDGASSQQASNKPATDTTKLTGTKMTGYTPTTTPITELKYDDTKVGTGQEVKPGDTITALYTGWLATTGVIFDAAADHGGPQTFSLSQVIAGWSQGIPGMKVGGTRRLYIPASLGYGSQGNQGIPPNSDLVFDVTVVAIGS